MSYEITEYEKPKTLVLGKMSAIKNEIQEAHKALQEAKDRCASLRSQYINIRGFHPIKKHKLKKELEFAMHDLTIANSEALIQNFKIMGYIIELMLLCFLIPMDGIQKTVQWCAAGFEERDARVASLVRKLIPLFEQNKQKRQNKPNILEGVVRILIVAIALGLIIFGITRLVLHKKSAALEPTTQTTNTMPADDSADALQKRIIELENSLNELKKNVEGNTILYEESELEIIKQTPELEVENDSIANEMGNELDTESLDGLTREEVEDKFFKELNESLLKESPLPQNE